jgi:hypothetical protein
METDLLALLGFVLMPALIWWIEPLQGEALDATLAALEPAPKWSVALGA